MTLDDATKLFMAAVLALLCELSMDRGPKK